MPDIVTTLIATKASIDLAKEVKKGWDALPSEKKEDMKKSVKKTGNTVGKALKRYGELCEGCSEIE